MHEEPAAPEQALSQLRHRLEDGLAAARLSRTQLAVRAEVSRTTVYDALRAHGPVPSPETVAALVRLLKLPVEELLELRRRAVSPGSPVVEDTSGPGRRLSQWDPHDLEVHPAGDATGADATGGRVLSGYVARAHDRVLAEAVREAADGRSRMVVLVGSSSTGKTRACWEAVQPLAERGWLLWHPFDPTRAEAALEDLHQVGPHTVVWLNEAQHYLGDPTHGERIAAAVHRLLTTAGRSPVLVLGTLWPEYADRYTALPPAGGPDPHSRTRELLSGRRFTVPDTFDDAALATARALAAAGDVLLASTLTRTSGHGRLAQDLAGAPELLRRYEEGTPAARAILEAAMDARRLGVGLDLGQSFLTDAAADYLTDTDFQNLNEDWAEAAYAELARPVHGKQAPLSRTRQRPARHPPTIAPAPPQPGPVSPGPVFRLADYLEEHGRTTRLHLCPPASFWHAAHTHLLNSPDDIYRLSRAAYFRYRLQWAHHLRQRAADAGSTEALHYLAQGQLHAGDRQGAEALLWRAFDAGDTREALRWLAHLRQEAGDWEEAEALLWRAADADAVDVSDLLWLAELRQEAGNRDGAEALLRRAADAGDTTALLRLAELREKAGEWEEAEALLRRAIDADADSIGVLLRLVEPRLRNDAGDRQGAEALLRWAADAGDTKALLRLAELREDARDRDGA
ncbi:helix-turn-helix domain-containing protein, partial [Streptomyces sp. NPDC057557]|uniref:helix-turn-helix domain-containing protein n=1 Tax=Streptomyces sp. NPDC057557 TaxID=3346167 RepID=UPI0036CB20AD